MSVNTGVRRAPCPLCAESNPETIPRCRRCDYRLPWADKLEGKEPQPVQKSAFEKKLEKWLLKLKWLPPQSCICRFCYEVIESDVMECPHCKALLTAHDKNLSYEVRE